MIKLAILLVLLLTGSYSLRAADVDSSEQDFLLQLNTVKNPFEDGFPKPTVIPPKPVVVVAPPRPVIVKPKPQPVVEPEIVLPTLNLQGVLVGAEMHQAIINDQIIPLYGYIEGARIVAMNKTGVYLYYKGKKFFLKIE